MTKEPGGITLAVGGTEEPSISRLLIEFACSRCGGQTQAEGASEGARR